MMLEMKPCQLLVSGLLGLRLARGAGLWSPDSLMRGPGRIGDLGGRLRGSGRTWRVGLGREGNFSSFSLPGSVYVEP